MIDKAVKQLNKLHKTFSTKVLQLTSKTVDKMNLDNAAIPQECQKFLPKIEEYAFAVEREMQKEVVKAQIEHKFDVHFISDYSSEQTDKIDDVLEKLDK